MAPGIVATGQRAGGGTLLVEEEVPEAGWELLEPSWPNEWEEPGKWWVSYQPAPCITPGLTARPAREVTKTGMHINRFLAESSYCIS